MQELVLEESRDPIYRRWWLLLRALEGLPLDAALALANRAEAFVLSGGAECHVQRDALAAPEHLHSVQSDAPPKVSASGQGVAGEAAPAARLKATEEASPADCARNADGDPKAAIMARFAEGARNAVVAAEFGLTQRQVQGFRMQLARGKSIVARVSSDTPTRSSDLSASVDAVVRYLRQQGDVVVAADSGRFLLNGRFTLAFNELVERANRMLARNGKDLFTPVVVSVAVSAAAMLS